MAGFRDLCIVLAAQCSSFTVMFQAEAAGTDAEANPPRVTNMIAEAPVIRAIGKHYSSSDHKSAAGGDVILGGFLMVLLVAVVCYLRVTTRRQEAHA